MIDAPPEERDDNPFRRSPRVQPEGGFLPAMVSYAQNFEDVILRRALQDVERGLYVDIGAWHPVEDSVTCWFYGAGWRGVNVEPEPEMFARLEGARPEDQNVCCLVGGESGISLFTAFSGLGLSSGVIEQPFAAAPQDAPRPRILPMPTVTLDQVLALRRGREIDFLKIDVEGMEGAVLNAASFARHRPRIVLVEATLPHSQLPSHREWEEALLSRDYAFVYFDGLNRFYLRAEDAWRAPIFQCPPCCFDNFWNATLSERIARRTAQTPPAGP